jgi:hypothetical protein
VRHYKIKRPKFLITTLASAGCENDYSGQRQSERTWEAVPADKNRRPREGRCDRTRGPVLMGKHRRYSTLRVLVNNVLVHL